MLKFIIKRILWMIPIMLGVIVIVFTIEYFTPGDPVLSILGTNFTEEQYAQKAAELGVDKPYIVQLGNYIWKIITKFDFGTSFTTKRSVTTQLMERFKPTFIIGVVGVIVSALIAIPLGVYAALHHAKPSDFIITAISIIFAAVPGFWLAIMLMLIFCLRLNILPAAGIDTWKGYILPIFCSALGPFVMTCRMTRSSMLEVVRQDYIRTAKAKGLPQGDITRRHTLRNAMIPVITLLAMNLGHSLGGSIMVETIFTVPGIGILMRNAIGQLDYPMIHGGVLFLAFVMCVMNLLADLAYAVVDPRVFDQYVGGKRRKRKKEAAV